MSPYGKKNLKNTGVNSKLRNSISPKLKMMHLLYTDVLWKYDANLK